MNNLKIFYFFGSVTDPEFAERNKYSAPWINVHQLNIIEGLINRGFKAAKSFAPIPYASFPRNRKVVIRGRESKLNTHIEIVNPPYLNVPLAKQVSIAINIANAVRKRIKTERPAFFLSYNPRPFYAGAAMLFSKVLRVPMIILVADFEHRKYLKIARSPLRFLEAVLSEMLMRSSDGLICYSRRVLEDISYKGPWIKMEGAISKSFEQVTVEEQPRHSGLKIIMYSGALNNCGGIELLLAAFKLIEEPDYRLWITGRGFLEKSIIETAEIDKRIEYLSYLNQEEYRRRIADASVLINPRLSHLPENRYNFPSKFLDYLASGKPVITTSTGDVEEDYGGKAYFLKDETPQGLARLIEEVVMTSPQERERKGTEVRKYMIENKTWDKQCDRIYDFITSLIKDREKS